ncbi:hypothetical protein [Lacticaseibacillus paracasei]|uniref:hypothetical protein n=1 Tax=Lacticaseibacillus paracasei TaxID=1597 RepID=UPI001950A19E|nr:hypothetical protein [Lacticaseibacillus paracasei]MBM6411844.1 hypothetical protein [Lacticaseibacillus paracasei]
MPRPNPAMMPKHQSSQIGQATTGRGGRGGGRGRGGSRGSGFGGGLSVGSLIMTY